MLRRVHHVGLVVRKLEDGLAFWQDRLGLKVSKQATVKDQGVKAALLPIGRSEIELLEPIDPAGGVAKFLAKRGEGLHHVCFETADVGAELAAARGQQFPLIDEAPRAGLAGMICFLHPKGTRGVLVEFATPPPEDAHHPHDASTRIPGLALDEVVARSRDAEGAATLFADAWASRAPRPAPDRASWRPRCRRAACDSCSSRPAARGRSRPRGRRRSRSRARGSPASSSSSATSARPRRRSARSRRRRRRVP
jgi:methylmalonyl-CoA/ethylmalonyl-CoA epimerase